MKKILFLSVSLVSLFLLAACGGNKAEQARQDSIRVADSLAAVEAARQAAEQARLDSIRQDSIRQDSIAKAEAAFMKAIPNPKDINWAEDIGPLLKKRGFVGSTRRGGEYDYEGTYTLQQGPKTCTIYFNSWSNGGKTTVTITGDPAALSNFYNKAKKLKASYFEGGTDVTKSGNTVIIDSFGA